MWVLEVMLQQKQKTQPDYKRKVETFNWQEAIHPHGDQHWGYFLFVLFFQTFIYFISVTAISLHFRAAGQDLIWDLPFLISEGNFSNLDVMR